ncbi:MAG: RidA family protein [Cytophagales bacterium]|nr:RidA family protein [Cytophagales bacterium]
MVRTGNVIEIAGTTATDEEGQVIGTGDPYLQTKYIFEKINGYLEKAGASMEDIVRTRMYVTDISKWQEIGRAHGEYLKTVRPAATMVEVSKLIDPELLIEIEVTAIILK